MHCFTCIGLLTLVCLFLDTAPAITITYYHYTQPLHSPIPTPSVHCPPAHMTEACTQAQGCAGSLQSLARGLEAAPEKQRALGEDAAGDKSERGIWRELGGSGLKKPECEHLTNSRSATAGPGVVLGAGAAFGGKQDRERGRMMPGAVSFPTFPWA